MKTTTTTEAVSSPPEENEYWNTKWRRTTSCAGQKPRADWKNVLQIRGPGRISWEMSVYNNIIYNLSPAAKYHWSEAHRSFDGNLFFGFHPADEPNDPHKLVADPQLTASGTGQKGLATLEGYWLKPGSPCIRSGVFVPGHGEFDLWRNLIPAAAAPDRGANEFVKKQ